MEIVNLTNHDFFNQEMYTILRSILDALNLASLPRANPRMTGG